MKNYTTAIVHELERRPADGMSIIREPFDKLDSAYYLNMYENQRATIVEPRFIKLGMFKC